MKLSKFLLLAACAMVAIPAHATNVWSDSRSVAAVQVVVHGGFLVTFTASPGSAVDTTCTDPSPSVYVFAGQNSVTADGANAMLSVALTALTTGMKVTALYENSSNRCYVNNLKIVR